VSDDFPLPDLEWEPTREFWAAAARRELVIPRCADCGTWVWYPRESCAACQGSRMPWTPVSGRGHLFSWAVVRRALVKPFAGKVPYLTGLVALEEDPKVRLVTTLVDCAAEELRVDLPVRVVFRPLSFPDTSREVIAPLFRPAE
jgi:uncharacterized OB-fold protein